MKSVGETMAIGRTFKEALNKAVRSLEIGQFGLGGPRMILSPEDKKQVVTGLTYPNSRRLFQIAAALRSGFTIDDISRLSGIDPWFVHQIRDIVDAEAAIAEKGPDRETLHEAKRMGFADRYLAMLWNTDEHTVRAMRTSRGILPVYKLVDTCAAEFEAYTPYYYSTYEEEDEANPSERPKVIILGGGPNRIGQGIEFDYCCVHASFALRELGIESIMVNSNPETVSTDYDISDKLFFEPLTLEDVLNVVQSEKPMGVIVQFGGQTPLNLARGLAAAGVPILGTQPDAIDRAEDRRLFLEIVNRLRLKQPESSTVMSVDEAVLVADRIGYPVLVRPSYVLGGRSMEIIYDTETLRSFMAQVLELFPENQILIDKFLEDAIEVDVDSISDGKQCVICGVMEHIEEAGIHSGDSACVLPPPTLKKSVLERLEKQTKMIAKELGVVGLMNIQYAIKGSEVYVLEVNPRASRTVPFVSKAIGVPLAKLATKVMLGHTLKEMNFTRKRSPKHVSVKESVFPFKRFPKINIALGPEMKSTGEVMGMDATFELAFAKSQLAAGCDLPTSGNVFISVHDFYKERIVPVARAFAELGFTILCTTGTAAYLNERGVAVQTVLKVSEGRPNVADAIMNGHIQLVVNASIGRRPTQDAYTLRQNAIRYNIPYATTVAAARAMTEAIRALQGSTLSVKALQDYF
jgi:carbamoyl-phosphate synthase large subunit